MGRPSKSTCPASGPVMRVMIRISEVLPAPLGPSSPNTLPAGTVRETSSKAVKSP